jgi:hypothetical protein
MTATGARKLIIHGRHALPLAGWGDYSVWGMDPVETTYGLFAQLWHNTDADPDNLRHWISEVPDLPTLCHRIALATGRSKDEVADAMLDGLNTLQAEQGITVIRNRLPLTVLPVGAR